MIPTKPADPSIATWRKSTRSAGGGSNCVEIARLPGLIAIRDSQNTSGTTLIISHSAFKELVQSVRHSTFNAWPKAG